MDGPATPQKSGKPHARRQGRTGGARRPLLRDFETRFLLVLLAVLLVVLWDWNWWVPIVERQASTALGRQVTIGALDLDLGRHPQITLGDIAIANPPEFAGEPTMLHVKRVAVRADLPGFFRRRIYLDEVAIERVSGSFGRAPSGTPNWVFEALQNRAAPDPDAEPWIVEVAQLDVAPSQIRVVDPKFKSDFTVRFRTGTVAQTGESQVVVEVAGTYAGQPVEGQLTGGSALTLRDPAQPYPIDLRLANGATRVRANGTLLRPLEFGGADVKLEFVGDSLADLFALTGIPLPETAPYHLTGQLDYNENRIRFRDFVGRVGSSDLSGTVSVDPHRERPFVTAELASRQVVFADLGGLIGAAPGEAKTTDPEALKRERAEQAQRPRVLPDTPINLPRLRAADLEVHYKADRIVSDSMPFDNMDVVLALDNGDIRLKPVKFRVGEGSIVANVALDAREDLVRTRADVDVRKLDLSKILDKMGIHKGEGRLGGRAVLTTSGNSVAQALARGDGSMQLFMSGGNVSSLVVNLAGLDFGNALLSAIGIPSRARLRCMVADVGLDKGRATAKTFLVDTEEANILVTGSADFRDESLAMRLETHPKQLNLLALRAPINLSGTFKNPKVMPDRVVLAQRAGAAIALGVLLTPLAALLPTLQLGMGEDTDCRDVLDDVKASAMAPSSPEVKR